MTLLKELLLFAGCMLFAAVMVGAMSAFSEAMEWNFGEYREGFYTAFIGLVVFNQFTKSVEK